MYEGCGPSADIHGPTPCRLSVFHPSRWKRSRRYRRSSVQSPEIFRVLGKRRPAFVRPYLEQLRHLAETAPNLVVRIHYMDAIKKLDYELKYLSRISS